MVDAALRQRWEETAWLMSAVYNAQPGRKRLIKPHHLNPYRGLWPVEADVDLDQAFGIKEAEAPFGPEQPQED